jgi:enoyl-CoA hydratase
MGYVTFTREIGIGIVAIDKPPANALDVELLEEIVAAIDQVASDPPGAVVVTGREGFFSAGVDLKAEPTYGPAERRRMVAAINEMALGVYGLACPVVGSITGHAVAGGLVLALSTDLRVASNAGRYGLTEISVGVPYPQAAIGVVQAALAPHAARSLVFGNQLIGSEECLRLGVFDEIVPPEQVLGRALEIASELASFPAETYTRTKRELRGQTVERLRNAAASDPLLDIV